MPTMSWFSDRYGPWALVAGASEGIGAAFARSLARRGLDLLLIARREDKLRATAAAIAAEYEVRVDCFALDLAASDLLARVREGVGEREIGLLVYNAAYSNIGDFFEQSLEDKLRALDVNCRAPLTLCHELGGPMRARGRGGIILMGSMSGMQGSPRLATYAATKAFDLVLGESLWGELRGHGVDVLTCVAGATRTPGFEATASDSRAPVMEPHQVAEEALTALGWQPSLVPGLPNKLASLILSRLPRRRRVLIMASALAGDGTREKA